MFATKEEIITLGRLKKRSDFLCVQKSGRKWVAKGMIVEIAPKETAGLRYGLTVSKKVSKKAVVRNHIKRRLKSVACDVLPAYTDQNLDIVLIGRVEAGQRSYEDLQNDLRWCLKKMGIEKNNEKTAD